MSEPMEIGESGMDRIILSAALSTPWMVPCLRAVRDGKIELNLVGRNGKVQRYYGFSDKPTPILIIIGDDDGDDRGPAGWPQIRKTVSYGEAIMLNASGGDPDHYRMAVERTQISGIVVMIETASRHLPAWGALLLNLPLTLTSTDFRELIERTPGLRYATNKGIQWVRGLGLKPTGETSNRFGERDR